MTEPKAPKLKRNLVLTGDGEGERPPNHHQSPSHMRKQEKLQKTKLARRSPVAAPLVVTDESIEHTNESTEPGENKDVSTVVLSGREERPIAGDEG